MVSIVSGAGVGLSNTSKELAGQAGELGTPSLGRAGDRITVNAATGNLVVQNRDEFLVGIGEDVEVLRTYNSLGAWDGDNGDNWRLGYYRRVHGLSGGAVNTAGTTVRRIDADGYESTYIYNGSKYVGKDGAGAYDSLAFDTATSQWTWTDGDTGVTETYAQANTTGVYRLTQVTDTEGHSVRLTYYSTDLIATIATWRAGASGAAETVTLAYDTATRRLALISTSYRNEQDQLVTRTRERYEYDEAGRLSLVVTDLTPEHATVSDGQLYWVRYGYDDDGRVTSIAQRDGTSLAITYDSSGRVSSYTDGLKRTTTLTYDTVSRRTTVSDALGQSTVMAYDSANRLIEISGALTGGGTFKQSLAYDGNGNLIKWINPANEAVTYAYDGAGNRIRTTDAAGNVEEQGYDASNRLVSRTGYSVADPDGAAGAALPSGAQTTRLVYDADSKRRLRFTISPEGRVTRHDYDAAGLRTASTTYTSALYSGSGTVADLTNWSEGLSLADKAAAQRREYAYDPRGQLVSSRTYAGTSVGTAVTYTAPTDETYAYDAFGRLLQSTNGTGNVTSYAYDGLNRVVLMQDGANAVTLYQYDDAGNRTTIRRAVDGTARVEVFDAAGQLVSSTEGNASNAIWSRTFSNAAAPSYSGLGMPSSGTGISADGYLTLSTGDSNPVSYRLVYGTRTHRFDSGVKFQTRVQLSSLASGQWFAVGASNASANRYHWALFRDGVLYAQYVDAGGTVREVQLSSESNPLLADTTYYVEVETSDAGTVLYVHRGDRFTGFIHRANVTNWGTAKLRISAQTSPGRPETELRILGMSEERHGSKDQVYFDQSFGQGGTAGFSLWPTTNSLFTQTSNGLRVDTSLAGLSNVEQTVLGDAVYGGSEYQGGAGGQVTLRAEVTTSASATGRNFRIGAQSGSTGAAARALAARFIGGDLYAEYRDQVDGAWRLFKLSDAVTKPLKDGTTYVIEVVARLSGGAFLYVFEKGSNRAAPEAFSYTLDQNVWSSQRFFMTAFGDETATSAVMVVNRVQEINEGTQVSGVRTRYAYDKLGRLRAVIDATDKRSHVLYDGANRKVADIDATGRMTEYIYDRDGRLVQAVEYATRLSAAALASLTNSSGEPADVGIASVRPTANAANDRITTRYYDTAGRLVGLQDAAGYLTETRYDGTSRVIETIAYATAGTVVRQSVSGGNTIATAPTLASVRPAQNAGNDRRARNFYGNDGLLLATLDGEGHLIENEYDAAGRRTAQTAYYTATASALRTTGSLSDLRPGKDLRDRREIWIYDNKGRVAGSLNAEGYLTAYEYDHADRLMSTIRYRDTSRLTVTSSANVVSYLSAGGLALADLVPASGAHERTDRTYTGRGELLTESVTAVPGTPAIVTRHGYDGNGRLLSVIRDQLSDARVTQTSYNGAGQVVSERSASGALIQHFYDAAGRRIKTTDPRNNSTVFYYDEAGRLVYAVKRTAQGGEVTETLYNGLGQVDTTITHANRLSVTDANAMTGGLVTSSVASMIGALSDAARDNKSTLLYTRRGEIQTAIDALGNRTDYTYNAFGQVARSLADVGDGRRTQTDLLYDRRGRQLSSIVDQAGLNLRTATEYDAFGRVIATTDVRGNRTTTQYLKNDGTPDGGRKVVVTDPNLAGQTTVYDFMDRVVATTDRLGLTTTFVHDPVSRTMRMTTPEGIVSVTEYSRHGEVIKITDGNNATTSYTYDKDGRVLTVTDGSGNVTKNVYDANGNKTQVITGLKSNGVSDPTDDGSAVVVSYTYDAANRVLTRQVDPTLKLRTSYQYDGQGRAVKVTDAKGVVTTYVFDANGQLKDQVVDDITGGLKLTTSYSYDAQGRTLSVIEAAGTSAAKTTDFRYDVAGRRTHEIVDPAGLNLATTYEYDAAGNAVLKRDAMGFATRYVYDKLGRLQCTIDATGAVHENLYDAEGRVAGERSYINRLSDSAASTLTDAQLSTAIAGLADPRDRLTQLVYGKDGRLTYQVDAEGAVIRMKCDGAGRVVETRRYATAQSGAWTIDRVPVTHSNDQTSYTVYDAAGRARYTTDALDYVTETVYDRGGRVVAIKRYAEAIARPAVMTEANLASAVAARLDPVNDRIEYFAYDAAGRQRYKVDAEGYATEFQLDGLGRVIGTVRHASKLSFSAPPTLAQLESALKSVYTFDADLNGFTGTAGVWEAGKLKLIAQPEANGTWAGMRGPRDMAPGAAVKFDLTANELQAALHAGIDSPTSTNYGRVVVLLQPDGRVYVQTADSADVWSTKDIGSYVTGRTYTVEIATGPTSTTVYFYTRGTSRASGYVYRIAKDLGWTSFSTVFYTQRNPALTSVTTAVVDNIEERSAAVSANHYDSAGRLIRSVDAEGVVTRYAYDALGRITEEIVAYGLPEASTTRRIYDTAGRLTEETRAYGTSAASTTRYRYDADGRVIATIDPRGVAEASAAGLTAAQQNEILDRYTTRYAYDVVGRRTTVTDALGGATVTEYDTFGNAVKVTDPRGNSGYFYFDRLNRNTLCVDPEGFVSRSVYNAFGNKTGTTQFYNRAVGTWTTSTPPAVLSAAGTSPYVLADAGRDSTVAFAYDRRGLLTTRTDAENVFGTTSKAYETYAYDAFGNRASYRNKVGGVFTYQYDRRGLLVRETKPITTKTAGGSSIAVVDRHVYDALGHRIQLIEAEGAAEQRTTDFRVDLLGRVVETRGQALTVYGPGTGYASAVVPLTVDRYDARGNLISRTDANGNRTAWYYDALGRKIGEVSPTGTLSRSDYDKAGNLVSQRVYGDAVSLPAGTTVPNPVNAANVRETQFSYDANNREIEARMVGLVLGRYDEAAGQYVSGAAYGLDKSVVTKKYDAAGNLVKLTDPNGGVTYTFYDRSGQKVLEVDPEGYGTAWVYGFNGVTTRQISYARRHTEIIDETSDAATLIASWPADSANRITDYTYDRAFRLITEKRLSVAYGSVDANTGALTEGTGTTTQTYAYDGLNNKIRETDANGKQTDWSFDATGRLARQQLPQFVDHEGATVRAITDYEYNGLNQVTRTIARGKDGATEADDQVTQFVYGTGGRLLTQVDANGQSTQFDYDAAGNVTQRRKDRKNADGVVVTEGSIHTSDASGREAIRQSVTMAATWQYGDKLETRYNAYGEITGKRTNGGNAAGEWQEFAEYNAMGKVVKTNSGDGITKAYVYDAAGNATMSIESAGADLRPLTIGQILARSDIHQTFSIYDKRNQVISVIQPRMDTSREVADVQQFVAQQVTAAPGGGGQIQAVGNLLSTASTGSAPPPALTDAERFQPVSTQVTWRSVKGYREIDGFVEDPWYTTTTIDSVKVNLSVPSIGARLGTWARVRVRIDYDLGGGCGAREAVTTDRNATSVLVNMNVVREVGGEFLNLNFSYTVTVTYEYDTAPAAKVAQGQFGGVLAWTSTELVSDGEGGYYPAAKQNYAAPSAVDGSFKTNDLTAFAAAASAAAISVYQDKVLTDTVSASVIWSADYNYNVPGDNPPPLVGATVHWIDVTLPTPSFRQTFGAWQYVKVYIDYDLTGDAYGQRSAEATITDSNATTVRVNLNATATGTVDFSYSVRVVYYWPTGVKLITLALAGMMTKRMVTPSTGEVAARETINRSFTADTSNKTFFSGGSELTGADEALLFYRTSATAPYTSIKLARAAGVLSDSNSNPADPVPGVFYALNSSIPSGIVDYKLVALTAGTINGSFDGTSIGSTTTLNSANRSQAGSIFFDSTAAIHFFDQATSRLAIQYRRTNSSDGWGQAEAGRYQGKNNWFSWNWQSAGLSGAYDMRILRLDSAGNVTARMFTQVNLSSTPTAGALVPYSESDIVLTNQPASAAALKFEYWPVGSPSAAVERMFENRGNGKFGRNFANDNLMPLVTPTSSYEYGYSYEVYDAGGQVVNVAGGTFLVTPNAKEFLSHVSGRLPTIVPFAIADANALYMDIKYRPAGSTGAYTSVPRLSRVSNAVQFKWDASGITPSTGSAAFEYEYRLFDASGNAVRNPVGEIIVVKGQATVGDTPTELAKTGWVITGLDAAERTIRRRQAYNAFGEVASETDGRGYTTNLYYNTQGQLIRRLEPTTDVTGENGVTTRARPDTRYYYDKAGRAIATRDANGFVTAQAWTDGFTEAKVAKEFRPDGGQVVNSYDVFGNLRVAQDPLGRLSRYSYDKLNQLTRLDRPTRAAGQYLAGQSSYETYEYDSNGNRIATTNVLGRARTYYDIEGRVTKFTSIEGRSTSYAYTYENTIAGAGGKQMGGWVKTTTAIGSKVSTERKDTFGRMTWRQDFGGHVFNYAYNHAGWLTWQTSSLNGTPMQNLSYEYYANGYLKRQTDNVYHTQADYTYDENGNRVFEGYKRNDLASVVYSNSTVTYDELNRVKKVVDPKYEITYRYDAVGNRRNVYSYYNDGLDGSKQEQDYWYLYDSMNRFTVTMGKLSNGVISRGDTGKLISYNTASERMSAEYRDAGSGKVYRERYTYTSDGYLQDMFLSTSTDGSTFVDQSQAAATRDTDLAGRVLHYVERGTDNAIRTNVTRTFDRDNRQLTQVDAAQLHDGRSRTDTYSYNADGTLNTVVTTNVATGTTLSYAYEWWDSAKQTEIRIQAAGASEKGWAHGTSKLSYDLNGNLYRATDVGDQRTIQYVTDGEGQILYRQELVARKGVAADWNATTLEAVGGAAERKRNYYYLNGHRIGDVNNEEKAASTTDYAEALAQAKNVSNDDRNKRLGPTAYANFDENYQPINAAYPGTAPTDYTVTSGDTLRTIAARIWGDGAMWYLIAEANGLTGAEKLSEGMRLVIPNKVTNLHNNASTFKVYDAGEAIGDVSPTLPPPPPPSNGCGTLGMVIMIVIAVVVTIYTAGAAAAAMGSAATTAGGTVVAAGTTVGASSLTLAAAVSTGQVFAVGTAALSGGLGFGAAALGAAAIGGAAGSIASQGFAMAAGMQDKFDWKQVRTSALGSAVTAGVGAASRGIQALKFLGQNTAWHAAGRAAVGSGISQGLQGKWNWRNITAAAVGGGAGSAVGDALGSNGVLADLGKGLGSTGRQFVAGLAGGIAGQLSGPAGRMNFSGAFSSALGNALGQNLVQAASNGSYRGQGNAASPYVGSDTGDHIVLGKPYQPDFSEAQQFVGAFGDGSVPQRETSNDVLLAAGPGFKGQGIQPKDRLVLTRDGTNPDDDLDLLKTQVEYMQRDLDRILANKARARWEAVQNAASDKVSRASVGEPIRETVTPIFEPITVEVPPVVSAVIGGVGDVATGAIAGLADMTVAPIADLAQTGLKALHGAVTGDYQPLTAMSSYGDSVVNGGAGAWEGIKTTGVNVFNVSPVGMVYHAGTGGYGLTTAAMNGDLRTATRQGLGLGLNFAGAAVVPVGMARSPSAPSFLVQAETSALRRIAANNRAPTPWADLRRAYQQARGQVDFAHIEADVRFNAAGGLQKAQGGHFYTSPKVRVVPGTETVAGNGVVKAKVDLLGADGNFYRKTNNQEFSTLTPPSWSLARSKGEMSQAFLGRSQLATGGWFGTSGGVTFKFNPPNGTTVLDWRGFPIQLP